MKKLLIFLLFIIIFSCKKQSKLAINFNCNTKISAIKKEVTDFNKNFMLKIPKNWKTELYYNNFQSEIFTADTTKQLTETFILDVAYNQGNLELTPNYYNKIDSIFGSKNLTITSSKQIIFKSKPAYYYVAKGVKNNFPYQQLNLLVKTSENTYLSAYTEVYGTKNVIPRFCKSISILNSIRFL